MAFLVNLLIITSRSKNINSNFSSSLIKGTKVAIFSNRLFPLKIKINRKRTTKKSNFEGIERKNKNKKQKLTHNPSSQLGKRQLQQWQSERLNSKSSSSRGEVHSSPAPSQKQSSRIHFSPASTLRSSQCHCSLPSLSTPSSLSLSNSQFQTKMFLFWHRIPSSVLFVHVKRCDRLTRLCFQICHDIIL